LLAGYTAKVEAVRAITEILMEHRQEMTGEIPVQMPEVRSLLAQIQRPKPQAGLGPALHPGAASYYDRDKPSFLLAHADYVGLILTVGLMVGSWIWQLKLWMERLQKNNADNYSSRAVALMSSAQSSKSVAALDDIWRELLATLTAAVQDLAADKLSEQSFESFRSILRIAMDVTRDRRADLTAGGECFGQGAVQCN
jgi:uncharacterized protein